MLPDAQPIPRRQWWVFFGPSPWRMWWRIITPPGLRHCWAVTEILPGMMLVIDPRRWQLAITLRVAHPADYIAHALGTGARCVSVTVWPAELVRRGGHFGRWGTCASVVAYALGIDSRALRPQTLLRDLVNRHGAIEVTPASYGGTRWAAAVAAAGRIRSS